MVWWRWARSEDPVPDPPAARRRSGESVYTTAHARLFTTTGVLAAEQALLEAARRGGGRTISGLAVAAAVVESAANGTELNPGQAQLVTDLATSGDRLQLALAPAGTGKTTAMRVLARAWASEGGDVLGLAPSAVAAEELHKALGSHTDTVSKLLWELTHTTRPGPAAARGGSPGSGPGRWC